MPSDLTKRLREEVEYDNGNSDGPGEITYGRVFLEAATEIERLEAERDEARKQRDEISEKYDAEDSRLDHVLTAIESQRDAAQAEVARLRSALTRINVAWDNATRGNSNPERDLGWTGSRDNWGQIFAWFAKAALDHTEGGE